MNISYLLALFSFYYMLFVNKIGAACTKYLSNLDLATEDVDSGYLINVACSDVFDVGYRYHFMTISFILISLTYTIQKIYSPNLVQEFSFDQWEFEHNKLPIIYLSSSFVHPVASAICVISYAISGIIIIYLFIDRAISLL